ncbi:MAG: cohesin domain-containing protein, partial [Gemmatimonadales bacterium]
LAVGTITYGASQPTGWLTATLDSTHAPATLTVHAATGSLAAGSYTATIPVTSAVASNSPRTIAVTFTVAAGPAINLASTSLTFSATATGADPASQTVAVTNSGGGSLTGLTVGTISYGSGTGWLTATLDSTHAPATLTVHAVTGSLAAGSYTATIPVTSAVASNSPRTVSVTFSVTAGPAIGLSAATVTFTDTVSVPDKPAKTVTVSNTGGATLTGLTVGTISYGSETGWLTAVLNQATAPATLTLTTAKGPLGPGTYTATVPITSAVASNSPQTVTVTFTIAPLPLIGLSTASVTFSDTMLTSDPAAQTVTVTNAGTGTLGGLAVGTISYGSGTGWLTATLDQATAPATLTLNVAKGALGPGTYTATVPVTSAVAGNTPQTVAVTFTITPMPLIGLGTTSVIFTDTLLTPDPASRTVAVTNAGTGTLSGLAVGAINYVTGSGWLTATLDQATAPATLTLSVAKGALAAGTYTATVPVTAGFAGNAPQSVTVTFIVLPVPLVRIVLTPGFGVVPPAGTLPLAVQGFNAASGPAPTFGLRFLSRTPGVAAVDSVTGVVTGVARGSAVIVASAPGASGTVYDSTLVAVPTAGVAVALPVSNAHAFGAANVGDTVHVVVTVNLGAVPGELVGSYDAQMDWNPSVLQYVSTTPISLVGGTTLNESATSTGDLRFGSADPNGTTGPGLVDVKFVARASGASPLTFALTDLSGLSPTFTQMLTHALVLSGGVQVK